MAEFLTPAVVVCTCNPATLEAEFRNGVGWIPSLIQHYERSLTKYWDITET